MAEEIEESLNDVYQEALILQHQQDFVGAERKYKDFLHRQPEHAEAWLNLGLLYYQVQNYPDAKTAIQNSLELDDSQAFAYYILGLVLEKANIFDEAVLTYEMAIALEPTLIDAYNNLGNLLKQLGDVERAEEVYNEAISVQPEHFGSYINLGNLLLEQNQVAKAIALFEAGLNFNPTHPDLLNNLEFARQAQENPAQFLLDFGNHFYEQGKYAEASERYQQSFAIQPGDSEAYYRLSECWQNLRKHDLALSALHAGVSAHPKSGKLHFLTIVRLRQQGRTPEALLAAEKAAKLIPNEYVFQILDKLMLPSIYDTPAEIDFYRPRFIDGLQKLIAQTSLETPAERQEALQGISLVTNFYLAYQAQNDVDLQRQYGNLAHRIVAANYPDWVQPLPMPPLSESGKIRVGYVSAYLHSYSGTLWLTGWLKYCDRQLFEIYCYYTGNNPDPITQEFQRYSDKFYHIPGNLPAVAPQILADNLHILVFPEIGMDAPTIPLASLRLAPVQCVAWGHPVTTGLPTIDYFLSSELMEGENAQAHYSEKLIRLANIGVAYPKPVIPAITKTRADFELPADAVIYLCCQAPFKYLPQYDQIFPAIVQQVPKARFLFLRGELLKSRLDRAFAAVGLNSPDYCIFRYLAERYDYLAVNLLSDVFLDTITWSGGNTALEAIACNLPIVTCTGEFMRGRHSDSFLKMIGVTATIAKNVPEYVEIAVKLGLAADWRQAIAQEIAERQHYLYDDRTCVRSVEAFYQQVVQAGWQQG